MSIPLALYDPSTWIDLGGLSLLLFGLPAFVVMVVNLNLAEHRRRRGLTRAQRRAEEAARDPLESA